MRKVIYAMCEQQRRRSVCAAHSRSLISPFVVRCLDSIPLFAIAEISRTQLVSVAEQAGLSLTCSQTPKDGFSHVNVAQMRKRHSFRWPDGFCCRTSDFAEPLVSAQID